MIPILACLLLGPWEVTIPVEGLNDKTAAAFRDRIVGHFRTLTDEEGHPVLLDVRTRGDMATITIDCPLQAIAFSDLSRALEGSPFSLNLGKGQGGHWMVFGRASFCWTTQARLPEERIKALRALFKDIGTGTDSVEVLSLETKAGFRNRLQLKFGAGQSAPAFKIIEMLQQEGFKTVELIWEKGDRSLCGARRYGRE